MAREAFEGGEGRGALVDVQAQDGLIALVDQFGVAHAGLGPDVHEEVIEAAASLRGIGREQEREFDLCELCGHEKRIKPIGRGAAGRARAGRPGAIETES